MHELIATYCNTLKLGARIAKNYAQIQAETHEEFLAKLLAMEIEARECICQPKIRSKDHRILGHFLANNMPL